MNKGINTHQLQGAEGQQRATRQTANNNKYLCYVGQANTVIIRTEQDGTGQDLNMAMDMGQRLVHSICQMSTVQLLRLLRLLRLLLLTLWQTRVSVSVCVWGCQRNYRTMLTTWLAQELRPSDTAE